MCAGMWVMRWAALGLKRAAPNGCVCFLVGSNWDLEESKYDSVQRHRMSSAYCLRNQQLPPEKQLRITAIPWWGKMSNTNILTSQAYTPNSSLLWLGYVYRMVGRILKDIFCGELAAGKRITDRPHLRLMNVYKRDMRAFHIDMESWACLEADHTRWRRTLNQKLQSGDEKLMKVGGNKVLLLLLLLLIGGRLAVGMWWRKSLTAPQLTSRDGSDSKKVHQV